MKRIIIFSFCLLFLSIPKPAFSAAASPKGKQSQMKQQKMMQQKMIQQRKAMQQKRQLNIHHQINVEAPKQINASVQKQIQAQYTQQEQVKDVVKIGAIWEAFETSSEAWSLMIDRQPKEVTVARYINIYKNQGVTIRRPVAHYVDMIDGMSRGSPDMLKQPFQNILRFVAVMEYDFDNGQNKDEMALKALGQKSFEENKKRVFSQ